MGQVPLPYLFAAAAVVFAAIAVGLAASWTWLLRVDEWRAKRRATRSIDWNRDGAFFIDEMERLDKMVHQECLDNLVPRKKPSAFARWLRAPNQHKEK